MILVLGGTTEGRELAYYLQRAGFIVLLTTVSRYGQHIAQQRGVQEVQAGAIGAEELQKLLLDEDVKAVIDAAHPYAEQIRSLAQETCQQLGIPYGRYEREKINLPEHPLLYEVTDYEEAAEKAATLGECLFLTVGSRRLSYFTQAPSLKGKRLIARVLPEPEVIQQCRVLGLKPDQIIAVQGPFSREANLWMFRHFRVQGVVTKESGQVGGFLDKWEACLELGLPLVVISRPKQKHPNLFYHPEEVQTFIEEVSHNV